MLFRHQQPSIEPSVYWTSAPPQHSLHPTDSTIERGLSGQFERLDAAADVERLGLMLWVGRHRAPVSR